MKSQLDRILNSDISHYAIQVNERLSNIQQLEETLTERSNFIEAFQEMLRKQMESIDKPKSHTTRNNIDKIDTDSVSKSQKRQKLLKENHSPLQSLGKLGENIEKSSKQLMSQQKSLTQSNIINKCMLAFQSQRKEAIELKKDLVFFKIVIKQELEILNQSLKACIEQNMMSFQKEIESRYSIQIKKLKKYNQELQFQLQLSSRKQIDSKKQASLILSPIKNDYCQVMSQIYSYRKNYSTEKVYFKDENCLNFAQETFRIKNQNFPLWNHYKCQIGNQSSKINTNQRSQVQVQASEPNVPNLLKKIQIYDLPDLQKIQIYDSGVKQGFGIFQLGKQTLYKGLWKQYKFHGKGKLTLSAYTYEGNFEHGLFHGCGTITMGTTTFIGEFKKNQACGQGTLKIGNQTIVGRWDKNKFVKKY